VLDRVPCEPHGRMAAHAVHAHDHRHSAVHPVEDGLRELHPLRIGERKELAGALEYRRGA